MSKLKPIIIIVSVFLFLFIIVGTLSFFGLLNSGLFSTTEPVSDLRTEVDYTLGIMDLSPWGNIDEIQTRSTSEANFKLSEPIDSSDHLNFLIYQGQSQRVKPRLPLIWGRNLRGLKTEVGIVPFSSLVGDTLSNGFSVFLNDIEIYKQEGNSRGGGATLAQPLITIRIEPFTTDFNRYRVFVNGRFHKEVTITDEVVNMKIVPREIMTGIQSSPGDVIFKYKVGVKDLKYRPTFEGCVVEEGQIVFPERFVEGTTFNTESFKFDFISFCINNPPQILKVGVGQEPALAGELFTDLVAGKSLTVPEGQVWSIDYITNFEEGMEQSCPEGAGLSEVTGTICEQFAVEKEPVIIITPPTVITFDVGENDFLLDFGNNGALTGNKKIGDEVITIKPIWVCGDDFQISSQRFNSECYNMIFEGEQQEFNKNYVFNDFMTYNCQHIGGVVDKEGEFVFDDSWKVTCEFTISDDFLDITIENFIPVKGYFDLNEPAEMVMIINNNFFAFEDSGLKIDYSIKSGLQRDLDPFLISFPILRGSQQQTISLKTDEIAHVVGTGKIFITVDGKKILLKDNINFNYVVGEELFDTLGGNIGDVSVEVDTKENIINFDNPLLIGGVVFIILAVFVLIIILFVVLKRR